MNETEPLTRERFMDILLDAFKKYDICQGVAIENVFSGPWVARKYGGQLIILYEESQYTMLRGID